MCRTVHAELGEALIWEESSVHEACQSGHLHPQPDMIVLDLMFPGVSGLDGLIAVRCHFAAVPVLVFTALDDAKIAAMAMAMGAAGYVPKTSPRPVLAGAILEVLNGGTYVPARLAAPMRAAQAESQPGLDIAARVCSLSRCQIKVMQYLRRGFLNKQIAYELGIGETTVKAHVTAILRKLNAANRTQIVIKTANLDFEAILRNKDACEAASGGVTQGGGDGLAAGKSMHRSPATEVRERLSRCCFE